MTKITEDLNITQNWGLVAENGDAFELTLLTTGPICYRYAASIPPANAEGHIMKQFDTWIDQAATQNFWVRSYRGNDQAVLTMDATTADTYTLDFTNPVHTAIAAACVTF